MSMVQRNRWILFAFMTVFTCYGIFLIHYKFVKTVPFLKLRDRVQSDFTVTNATENTKASFKKIISTMDYGSSAVGKILSERRKHLMQFCDGKELIKAGVSSEAEIKSNFIYDRNHKIVYCAIEKCGTTFWKSVFSIMSGKMNVSDPYDVKNVHFKRFNTIENITFDMLYAILQDSMKMVVVRDPYARLFSAYLDKMFDLNPYYWSYGIKAIKKFRKKPSSLSLKCGHDLTFEELVKFFIYTEHHGVHRDNHFTLISDHCRPCQMKYDVILKMETLKKDAAFVLRTLKSPDLKPILAKLSKEDNHSEKKIIESTIKFTLHSWKSVKKCISRSEVIRRLWRSTQMRGYISKDIKYPLSKSEAMMISEDGLIKVFHMAVNNSERREVRAKNRQLALEEAYSRVPMEDLIKLQKIFEPDCLAFGYDCKPEYIFDKSRKPTSNFLDVWKA